MKTVGEIARDHSFVFMNAAASLYLYSDTVDFVEYYNHENGKKQRWGPTARIKIDYGKQIAHIYGVESDNELHFYYDSLIIKPRI